MVYLQVSNLMQETDELTSL